MADTRSFGIRERLFLAFGSVAAMTVLASMVAWFSFAKLSDNLDQIVADNIPAVTLAARLAEIGGVISATAPALAAAEDEEERDRAWRALSSSLSNVERVLNELNPGLVGPQTKKSLRSIIDQIAVNLRHLDTNVRKRFWFNAKNEGLTERLRWAHADLLDEIEPMIADSRFTIGVDLEALPKTELQIAKLRLETLRQEALLRLNATGNLIIGLIARAAIAPNQISLDDTAFFLSEVSSGIDTDLDKVRGIPGSLSLQQALQDILTFVDGENSLFQLRRDELMNQSEGRALVATNLELVGQLQFLINQRVEAGHLATVTATEKSRASTRQEKLVLLAVTAFSLLVAILVVWLYVGRSLVRRITSLDAAMGSIAEGDLKTIVPTGGNDEISDMAGSLSTFRDTLAETQAELVQAGKLAALGQLSAGIAHELKQPLAAIRSYAHNSRRLIEKDRISEASGPLQKISGLTERMGGTINHLRTLARRPSSMLESVDIKRVSDDALELLDVRFRELDIVVRRDFPETAVLVHAEAIRLEQVLINLLSNAIDSMKDTVKRELVLSIVPEKNKVTFRMTDSGCGISEQDVAHVFDPFFTTKDVGEGLGLGLSISYNIIKDFKGTMRVLSQQGDGTTFSIVLNQARENAL